VGVLRAEGEGAKRSLICSFCRTEWDYLRIACPACDERREEKLRFYTWSKFQAVGVEACDTCKAYIKTVDLTPNGLVVPEVDESQPSLLPFGRRKVAIRRPLTTPFTPKPMELNRCIR
jgi:FdhE protein